MSVDTVSVVVVTYSPGETLADFLASLQASTRRNLRVVLADNGSTDGAPEAAVAAAASGPISVELLSTGGNLGYGRAANAGVAVTDSEWVMVANPDLVFAEGSLDAMLDAAERWPRSGALGPLIRTPQGSVYPSARSLPSLGMGAGHAIFGWWWPSNRWSARYRQDRAEPVERTAGWLSGSCLLIRRSAFDSVGGFDPAYFMYFEDVDFGDRLARAGWLNIYVPDAEVLHLGSHATATNAGAMNAAHHQSALRYLSQKYSGLRWLPVRVAVRLGLAARQALATSSSRITGGARYQDEPTDRGRQGVAP